MEPRESFDTFRNSPAHRQESSHERVPIAVERIFNEAQTVFAQEAMRESDFVDLYGVENIAADQDKVDGIRSKWKKDDQMYMYAVVLEYLMYRQINNNKALGEKARVVKTSGYDDLINGTDLVVEFEEPEVSRPGRLGLAIDVTFGSKTLVEKFDSIKNEIERGTLAQIKYYRSISQGFRGELSLLPRVVVGVDKKQIERLADDFNTTGIDSLKGHAVTRALLHEMAVQLRTFAFYAERKGKGEVAKVYRRELNTIQAIIKDEYGNDMTLEGIRDDRVLQSIREVLAEKF